MMKNVFDKILNADLNITDTDNYDYKSTLGKEANNFRVRGSLRSQLDKFLPSNQFALNKKAIDENPLP